MKKIILLIMCLFLCSLLVDAKTIKYKSDNLLKECKIKITKEKSIDGIKIYNYHIYAKIEGQIVDVNNNSISNQPIYLKFNKTISTIYSNNDGIFEYEIDSNLIGFSKNVDYEELAMSLQFNNGSINDFNEFDVALKKGNDLLINSPNEIYIQLNRLYKELEISLCLSNNEIGKKETFRNNKDIIVLSSQTFSAQYYRDEIEKAKENIKKKLKQNNISYITAKEIMLNSNGTLKNNWPDILIAFISAETRIKYVGAKNINVKEIVLNNGNFISEWKDNLEKKIYIDILKQAKTKLEKQTGYTYYDSEVEKIICDVNSDFMGKQKKVKSNWKELVNKEIKKQQQLKWEQQQKIKRWKQSVHVVQKQLNRCPNCYRYSLQISLLMKTGDPNHTWLMMYCPQYEYYNEELSGF